MAQADGVVANGTGAAVRADLNDQLAAVFTNHSGSSEPSTTYAYQFWADTTANVLKIRNSANNGWITLRELDGTMLIEDGTASLPGLAFADDTNTGIFSGGADEINISTGGTERVVVNSSGDVGIGTTSPNQLLELGTADPVIRFSRPGDINAIDSTLGKIEFFNNDTSSDGPTLSASIQAFTASTTGAGGYLTFSTENNSASSPIAEAMRIDRLGNVGIGTASPSNALHVNSGTTDSVALFESGDTTARIILRDDTSTSGGYLGVVGEELTLSTNGSERVRIDSSGEVGIGTSSPGRPLQVAMNSAGATVASLVNTGGSGAQIGFQSSSLGSDATVRVGAEGTNFAAYTNNTERMRINSSGDVLIGTTTLYGTGATFRQNATSAFTTTITGTSAAFVIATGTYNPAMEVRGNGGIANYWANDVNLSDRNSKKDIVPTADTWDCIKEWEIVNYRYKDQSAESDLNIGVIAQQVAESCPEVITTFEEAKDDQPEKLGVKEQQMYWMAIKALQEAQVRIEQLEAKVAALEAG